MKSILVNMLVAMLLVGCVSMPPPSQSSRGAGWYTVKLSDTLYSIAWRYGLDFHELAKWNQIGVDEPIYPGQRLRLVEPLGHSTPAISAQASVPSASVADEPASSARAKTQIAAGSMPLPDPGKWIWPTRGRLLSTFLATRLDRRGIDIAGQAGQAVVAVADGNVVYSGNGLAGYGNLIIIKHSDTFLSAYAYCEQRLVEEGMSVQAGKQVATMGQNDNVSKLHFQIRRNGKPVDPLKYLPKQ